MIVVFKENGQNVQGFVPWAPIAMREAGDGFERLFLVVERMDNHKLKTLCIGRDDFEVVREET